MKKIMIAASILVLLSGCGGGSGSGDTSSGTSSNTGSGNSGSGSNTSDNTSNNTNGSGTNNGSTDTTDNNSNGNTNTTDNNSNTVNSTSDIVSSAEFDFAASRTIDINFDVPEARSAQGMLSLCNDYTKTDVSYDINYDSCTVQARLVNGVYSGKMELTNNVNSVIGVVWFTDSGLQPVYKEFFLENTAGRFAARGSQQNAMISWQ